MTPPDDSSPIPSPEAANAATEPDGSDAPKPCALAPASSIPLPYDAAFKREEIATRLFYFYNSSAYIEEIFLTAAESLFLSLDAATAAP